MTKSMETLFFAMVLLFSVCGQASGPELEFRAGHGHDLTRRRVAFRQKKACGYSPVVIWLSYLLAAASFAVMSGGTLWDAGVSILCVFLARIVTTPMELYHANDFFTTLVATYIQLVVAFVFSTYFSHLHFNNIIIGTLMMLFPGRSFMTAVRDVIAKDLSAGLIEAVEAIVVAVAIAIGSALAYASFPSIVGVMPL